MAIQTLIAIERIKDTVNEAIALTQAEGAIEVRDALLEVAPVNTGWSRANWVVQEDTPDTTPRESTGNVAAAQAFTDAKAALLGSKQEPSNNVYLTNNVPYVPFLNEHGTSSVPPMWIEAAVQSALPRVASKVQARLST